MASTNAAVYTVWSSNGMEPVMLVPQGDDHLTLAQARRAAANLRERGYRGIYVMDHVSGKSVR